MNTNTADVSILREFLQAPLQDGASILARFHTLPNAVYGQGTHPLERFVYVPGTRKDRVVLMAHCDTVWDQNYVSTPGMQTLLEENAGVLSGADKHFGIGADDRAGCAMLWLLQNSGHSLLILDGEVHGHWGAKYLCSAYPQLLKELNRHAYLVQLDLWGGDSCMYHGIANCHAFCRMVESWGFQEEKKANGTDISYIAKRACGVNLSVGYYRYHKPTECLSVAQWQRILQLLQEHLALPQKRYRVSQSRRCCRQMRLLAARCAGKCRRLLGRHWKPHNI